MTRRIRVVVADDSVTVRKRIVEVLATSGHFEVVGEATDGAEAVRLTRELRPDVLTIDMMMPEMDGLEATEEIMGSTPTPILVVSASTNRGELFKTYDALAAGAVDVLDKPGGRTEPADGWEARLISRVRMVSRIPVITHPRSRFEKRRRQRDAAEGRASNRHDGGTLRLDTLDGPAPRLVAIGASTGGPGAVLEVLRGLPADFPLPVVVLIHISSAFGQSLAEWLDSQVPLPVRCARDREPLPSVGQPVVLVAPPDCHLVLQGSRFCLTDGPERNYCRPSVDVLFESLATELGPRVIACLLTGMGRDGATGMLHIHARGGTTLAQDEASSVVFGMPGEAVRLGAASEVLPLDRISPALRQLAASTRSSS